MANDQSQATAAMRAYAAFNSDGSIDVFSLRTSIEECCYDAQTSDIAEVEIRILQRYESNAK